MTWIQTNGGGWTVILRREYTTGSNEKYRLTIGKGVGPAYGYDAMAHLNNSQLTIKDSNRQSQ